MDAGSIAKPLNSTTETEIHNMSRQCDICGKGTITGNTVSKSKNRVRRTWRPNIQAVKTMIGGTVITVKVCTRCLKANKIVKYV